MGGGDDLGTDVSRRIYTGVKKRAFLGLNLSVGMLTGLKRKNRVEDQNMSDLRQFGCRAASSLHLSPSSPPALPLLPLSPLLVIFLISSPLTFAVPPFPLLSALRLFSGSSSAPLPPLISSRCSSSLPKHPLSGCVQIFARLIRRPACALSYRLSRWHLSASERAAVQIPKSASRPRCSVSRCVPPPPPVLWLHQTTFICTSK